MDLGQCLKIHEVKSSGIGHSVISSVSEELIASILRVQEVQEWLMSFSKFSQNYSAVAVILFV
jgi:hypothetical protein